MVPRKKPSGAGNEQGSPTDTELAWLAGILDGEGWFGITRVTRKATGKYRYGAAIVMATTSDRLAQRYAAILNRAGISPQAVETQARMGTDGSWRRRKWNISVVGNRQGAILLAAVRPYLVEKIEQADLIAEYIVKRGELPSRPGGHNLAVNEEIRALGERYRSLLSADRNRDDPSTTTRLAPSG